MQTSFPPSVDPFASTAFLERLHARRGSWPRTPDDVAGALVVLKEAGLEAVPSRLAPGGIMGGLSSTTTKDGKRLFLHSFVIFCEAEGYLASVAGPGNGSYDTLCKNLVEAARAVVAEYDRRGHSVRRSSS